jgi:hypothetical protein
MRKLLQNKTVVAGLAAVAVLSIAGNFIRWPRTAGRPVHARTLMAASPVAPADFPLRPVVQAEYTLLNWRSQVAEPIPATARDPFRALLRPGPVGGTNAVPTAPAFTVQAISIEPGRSMAVINRRVVVAGDRIDGYVIEAIDPNRVILAGPAGRLAVGLGGTPQPAAKPHKEK